VAKELLSAGANVNAADSERRTPLVFAVKHGHAKIVKLLLDNAATVDWNLRDSETNESLIELASKTKNHNIIKLLEGEARQGN
jgi:ankyrin repeat protein